MSSYVYFFKEYMFNILANLTEADFVRTKYGIPNWVFKGDADWGEWLSLKYPNAICNVAEIGAETPCQFLCPP